MRAYANMPMRDFVDQIHAIAEHRIYEVEADSEQAARLKAIEAVYAEGGLEHANPRTVTLIRE